MLKKLIKHDLKYGVRMFAVLHIILIIGCLMARFLVIDHLDFSADPEEFAPVIALLIVVLTMLFSAISFGCCIMYAVRFYKNLFTDEGYITWTLPASPLTQLWAKILSASIWYVLDLTICFAAAWFLISGDNIQSALERIKPDFQAALGMSFSSFCGLVAFFSFVGILSCVLFIYTSIAIGQLVPALVFSIETKGKYAYDSFRDVENMIVYTGTHDNDTLMEWYHNLTCAAKRKVRRFLTREGIRQGSVKDRLLAYTLKSKAEYAIIPMADILGQGKEGHLNTPGTVGSPNWEWRMPDFTLAGKELKRYKNLITFRN